MLNHYTMASEAETVPFVIVHEKEVPFGYPDAGLHRQLILPDNGARCPDCGMWSTSIHEYHLKVVIGGTYNRRRSMTPFYIRVISVTTVPAHL